MPRHMNIFLTANMKTFEDFVALYSEGDEARANRGRSLFSYALGNSKAEERYKIVDFLLERNPSFAHKSSDGASLLHILLGAVKHDPARDAAAIRIQVLVDHGETFNASMIASDRPSSTCSPSTGTPTRTWLPSTTSSSPHPTRALQPSLTGESPSMSSSAHLRTGRSSRTASTTTCARRVTLTERNTHDHVH